MHIIGRSGQWSYFPFRPNSQPVSEALCDDSTPCDKNQKDKDIVDADGNKIKTPSAPTMTRARWKLDILNMFARQLFWKEEGLASHFISLCYLVPNPKLNTLAWQSFFWKEEIPASLIPHHSTLSH